MTLLNFIKTLFLLTLALYCAPFLIDTISKQYTLLLEPPTHVGLLSITKPLDNGDVITEQLFSFFKNPLIQGIIIKIDCTQTALGTSQNLFHDIRQLKKEYPKPIIAFIENKCLAGAYLIASSCDYIIAPESALIGNIGISFCNQALSEILPDSSPNIETITQEMYQQLSKQIALNRKLSLSTLHNWAEGKIFTATHAITLGLINEIGSLCTVIKTIKEKASIENEIIIIELPKREYNLFNMFFTNQHTIA
ncbi:MAG TPA: S49 family peptidase [Candidatus Babeliales bacterium]|nr:S49 family peptidase [Candidatus Babeliales bacterium]